MRPYSFELIQRYAEAPILKTYASDEMTDFDFTTEQRVKLPLIDSPSTFNGFQIEIQKMIITDEDPKFIDFCSEFNALRQTVN
jgi:hypothetical protein